MRNIQPGSLMLILTRASDSHIDNSHWDWIHANGCIGIDSQPRNFSSRHYLVRTTQNMMIAQALASFQWIQVRQWHTFK